MPMDDEPNWTEEEMKTDAWKEIHQPWVLDTKEKKLKAYKALLDCDFCTLLLNARGTRDLMAQGPEYSKMLADLKTDPMALERNILGGLACGMQAMAQLSKDLIRRNALPKNKPEEPVKNAAEAKAYAAKLFKAAKFAFAADMYNKAISLCQLSSGLTTASCKPSGDKERPVTFTVAATSRDEQNVEDEGLVHTLWANLAFCRVKQHRWPEVISACNEAIRLEPTYGKAILRRGLAKRMLKLWEEAIADANKAMRIAKEELEMGGDEKLNKDLIKEAEGLIDDVEKQVTKLEKDKIRQEREEKGIELGDGDPIFGTDFDHVLRRELRRLLPEPIVWIEEGELRKLGMCRGTDDVPVDGPEFLVEASVRSRGAKRYLFYSIDIAIPWRGIMYESGKKPHWLHDQFHGVARIYGVNHYTDPENWGMYVTEKPTDAKDVPQCTPMGCPMEPMIPLRPDGSVDSSPPRRCNDTQELIFQKCE